MLNISTPNRQSDRGGYERSHGAAPSTFDTAWRLHCTQSTMGKLKNEHKRENARKNIQQIQLVVPQRKRSNLLHSI